MIGLPRELGVRRKLLARFPYAIVFVESEEDLWESIPEREIGKAPLPNIVHGDRDLKPRTT